MLDTGAVLHLADEVSGEREADNGADHAAEPGDLLRGQPASTGFWNMHAGREGERGEQAPQDAEPVAEPRRSGADADQHDAEEGDARRRSTSHFGDPLLQEDAGGERQSGWARC